MRTESQDSVIRILLGHGRVGLLDEADLPLVVEHSWGYYSTRGLVVAYIKDKNGRKVCTAMHRVILGMNKDDKRRVKHIDGNALDNRRRNLRILTAVDIAERNKKSGVATVKHGYSNTPTYVTWLSMKSRCSKPYNASYPYYGGKGIKVCERWMRFTNFLEDMGPRPDGYELDRVDAARDYEPANCRWLSRSENRSRQIKTKGRKDLQAAA